MSFSLVVVTGMTQLVLDYSEGDARILVKAAFERTRGIKQYHESSRQIVGKTGMGIGSYGESVFVDFSESENPNRTPVDVRAEKEVEMNITANAEKYRRRFLDELERLRGQSIADVSAQMQEEVTAGNSKEVADSSQLSNGSSNVVVVMILVFVFFMFMMFVMLP